MLTSTSQSTNSKPLPFTGARKKFLKSMLPEFSGYVPELKGMGPRGIRGVKGKQKEWIRQHVLEKFVEEFNEQGTNVDLLLKVRLLIV